MSFVVTLGDPGECECCGSSCASGACAGVRYDDGGVSTIFPAPASIEAVLTGTFVNSGAILPTTQITIINHDSSETDVKYYPAWDALDFYGVPIPSHECSVTVEITGGVATVTADSCNVLYPAGTLPQPVNFDINNVFTIEERTRLWPGCSVAPACGDAFELNITLNKIPIGGTYPSIFTVCPEGAEPPCINPGHCCVYYGSYDWTWSTNAVVRMLRYTLHTDVDSNQYYVPSHFEDETIGPITRSYRIHVLYMPCTLACHNGIEYLPCGYSGDIPTENLTFLTMEDFVNCGTYTTGGFIYVEYLSGTTDEEISVMLDALIQELDDFPILNVLGGGFYGTGWGGYGEVFCIPNFLAEFDPGVFLRPRPPIGVSRLFAPNFVDGEVFSYTEEVADTGAGLFPAPCISPAPTSIFVGTSVASAPPLRPPIGSPPKPQGTRRKGLCLHLGRKEKQSGACRGNCRHECSIYDDSEDVRRHLNKDRFAAIPNKSCQTCPGWEAE